MTKYESEHEHKTIGMATLVINIIADLCPHGMLPLAYGFAQGGPTGLVPALGLVLLFGTASGYSMSLLAKLANETNSDNIGGVWSCLIGSDSQWVVDASIFSLCFGCCIFYSAFVGDIFSALSSIVFKQGLFSKRWFVLSAITVGILLPLCLLEDLSALQFTSLVGVAGILYTTFFHIFRYLCGTYSVGSPMLAHLSGKLIPRWPSPKFVLFRTNGGSLVLMNMLCVAFLAHYNAISYRNELKNSTPQRFNMALMLGFGTAMAVFVLMMLYGYSLFGIAAQPLLLNNFARTQDVLASVARLAVGGAIVCAYPLMFAGLKTAMCNLLQLQSDGHQGTTSNNIQKTAAVVSAVAAILAVAIQCGEEDVSLVLGLVGSVLGCVVAYVMPGYLHLRLMRRKKQAGESNPKWEVAISHALVAGGAVLAVLGAWITIRTELSGHHH